MFPVETRYLKHGDRRDLGTLVATTVPEALRHTAGHVLVFLPGVGEILRCQRDLAPDLERQGHAVLPLFGDMPPEQQDRVLEASGDRKVILATNVAETSLTIPGVTAVIDGGLARQVRVSHATGLPRLELVPISQAAADQRAGRAGRTAAGVCWRLWDEAGHHRRPDAEPPEAVRGDLAGPWLQLCTLGETTDFPFRYPSSRHRGSGVTDSDPSDSPGYGRGGVRSAGISDADPHDPPGRGRGGYRAPYRTGINDSDPYDPAGGGRGGYRAPYRTGFNDSDPYDPPGGGRGGYHAPYRTGISDSDPHDPPGGGRGGYRAPGDRSASDSDPRDPAGRGRRGW
jgi:hypothetical protein